MTGRRALHERPPGLSIAVMGEDAANGNGGQRDKRQQRLAEALRRNLKRRKAQDRGRVDGKSGDKPGGEPGATSQKTPDADGT